MKGIKYRCGNCAEYFTDINNHLNNTDHTGDFKIGIFKKNKDGRSGFRNNIFSGITYELNRSQKIKTLIAHLNGLYVRFYHCSIKVKLLLVINEKCVS